MGSAVPFVASFLNLMFSFSQDSIEEFLKTTIHLIEIHQIYDHRQIFSPDHFQVRFTRSIS
jgi:hypothetical protein